MSTEKTIAMVTNAMDPSENWTQPKLSASQRVRGDVEPASTIVITAAMDRMGTIAGKKTTHTSENEK
jgi:hypothetical protein